MRILSSLESIEDYLVEGAFFRISFESYDGCTFFSFFEKSFKFFYKFKKLHNRELRRQ